ncbi:class I lanthipeptide [Pedobacter sp. R20-19]|uniref:class I lanthipeptide n=1 Tax=Pedobacter sp. R20-19 TaxID=1270196 RepID=UPI0004936C4A|nr:class I lanthipeptide [Pedobacter sp. R20-19]
MEKKLSKLTLNKETIETLNVAEMAQTNGGFTYSLSWGEICRRSKELGASNAFECGQKEPVEEEVDPETAYA